MTEFTVAVDRPKITADAVRQRAATALCTRLGSEFNTDDAIAEMAKAMRFSSGSFELAKALEMSGWSIDDDLLEELLEADHRLLIAHQEVIAEWVLDRKIKPLRDVGAAVTVTYRGKPLAGEITRIDPKHATYSVYCPDLGHVRAGAGTHGIVVPFEDVHGLCPSPESFALEMEGAAA